jgi:RNA polymerase sigma factor (sigma-70 family)
MVDRVSDAFDVARVSDNYKDVTLEQEQALVAAWKEKRDEQAFEKLMKIHEPYLRKMGDQYARQYSQIDDDDISQEARIGFMNGIDKYDPSYGIKPLTYAAIWVDEKLKSFVAKNRVIQKRPTQLNPPDKEIIDRYNDLMRDHNRRTGGQPPTQEQRNELSRQLGRPLCDVEKLLRLYYEPGLSLDQPVSSRDSEEGSTFLDFERDAASDPFEILVEAAEQQFSESVIKQTPLTKRERQVIEERYQKGDEVQSLEKVGQALNISTERVRQLKESAIRKMRSFADHPAPPENPDLAWLFGLASGKVPVDSAPDVKGKEAGNRRYVVLDLEG